MTREDWFMAILQGFALVVIAWIAVLFWLWQ